MKTKKKILVGTRSSRLALLQAREVLDALARAFPGRDFELVGIRTTGDRSQRQASFALPAGSPVGVFTKEIEEALADGRVDMACHSAKDLPTELAPSLKLGAVLRRADPRDAWISSRGVSFAELSAGAVVGTASVRRRAQLLFRRPDVRVEPVRGNVETRLKKMRAGRFDGLVLAACGLIRLGLEAEITEVLDSKTFLPAPGQGAIAVEIRERDALAGEIAAALNHEETSRCVRAERSFLRHFGGGCQVPAGALAEITEGELTLTAAVYHPEGKESGRVEARGPAVRAEEVGAEAAVRLAENRKKERK